VVARVEERKERGRGESLSRGGKKNIPLSESFPGFVRSPYWCEYCKR